MAESNAKNTRSVIKNATMWGLSVKGKDNTIATKEEINESKNKTETPKISFWPQLWVKVWPNYGLPWLNNKVSVNIPKSTSNTNKVETKNTQKSEVVPQSKVSDWMNFNSNGISINQQQPVSSPFQNNINTPINNINVEQINNQWFKTNAGEFVLKSAVPFNMKLKELDKDKSKRLSKGVENLYIDAYNKWVNGSELTIEEVLGNKNYQQQLKGIDQKVLSEMIEDANYLAQGEYDTNNVLELMNKYKDLGLKMDLEDLPPQTKAQYIAANLEGNDGGIAWFINHISPLNIPWEAIEIFTGKNPWDYNEKMQRWAEENKTDFLTDAELKKMMENQIKTLDAQYKKYYTNDLELADKDLQKIVDKEYDKWIGTQMVTTPEQRKAKKEEIIKELGFGNLQREGKNWKDLEKKAEYERKIKELEKKAREEHWETRADWIRDLWGKKIANLVDKAWLGDEANWIKNLWLDAIFVLWQWTDLVRNIGTTAEWLLRFGKWGVHKAVEGYADLLDTAIATADTVLDKDRKYRGIEYRVEPVWEKVAKAKWYENYEAMINRMEQASEENPWLKVATWFLKQWEKDLGTVNALWDYIVNAYGSWENAEQTAKENPVQMASDIASIIQLWTLAAAKVWIIDSAKAGQIVKMVWYGDLYEQTLKWGNKLQFWPVLKWELAVGKIWAKISKAPFKAIKNFTDVFVNKLSWITKEERDFIKANPEKVEEFLKWDKNSQSLLDRIIERFDGLQLEKRLEWEEYEKIRTSNTPVQIDKLLDDIRKRLGKAGLELLEDWMKINKNYTSAINNKFWELGTFLRDLEKLWEGATAEDVWWARRQVDTLAKWEWQPAGLEADAINMIRDIRGILDNELKNQIPDIKTLDKSYRATIGEIKELKMDWFNKDGTLKDSAYSKIRNLTNKGSNQPKLARLERLLPWISEELKGLAVAESVEKAGKQMVGQYANQIFGVGGGIVGITSLLSGGLSAWPIILWVLWATLATPKNLVKLLKYQGKISRGFNNIINKISNGIRLTPAETQEFTKYLNDNKKWLGRDAKYMYEKGLIDDGEYKAALEKKEKEVKKTWNWEVNEYKNGENNKVGDNSWKGLSKKVKNEDKWLENNDIWENTINEDTGKPYTKKEVDNKVKQIRDRILGNREEFNKIFEEYKNEHEEIPDDDVVQSIFDRDYYINPDWLRKMINKRIAKELGVSPNILASTNHPAVSKISDKFIEEAADDVINRAKKGEDINIAFIWGWGGSWKSRGASAMIEEGFVKKWDKVQMTLDVQWGGDELVKIMEKAKEEWVLDKIKFKVAYVYASTKDAGLWVIDRTIKQNRKILEKKWLDPKKVSSMAWEQDKNRLYEWRTLPFDIFEEGHLKSISEKKWLFKYLDLAKEIDNIDFMITTRGEWGIIKNVIKKDGEWVADVFELDRLLREIENNKYEWLDWGKVREDGNKALKGWLISQRQYDDLFGKEWKLGLLLMLVSAKNIVKNENLD